MGDGLENRYLMGEKFPMNFGFANGGHVRGYVAGGDPKLPDDYTPSPIWNEMWTGQSPVKSHVGNHVLEGDLEGTSPATMTTDVPPMPATPDSGGQPDMGPFPMYSADESALTKAPSTMSGFNPNLGGTSLDTSKWGDAADPSKPEMLGPSDDSKTDMPELTGYGKQLARERQAIDELEKRTKEPDLLGKPLTPGRAFLLEMGAGMMQNGSPFFGTNLGAGLAAGVKGFADINNQYVNQAAEGAKAENMLSELSKPMPTSYLQSLIDPTTGQQVGAGSGAGNNAMLDPDSLKYVADNIKTGNPAAMAMLGTGNLGAMNKAALVRYMSSHPDEYDPVEIAAAKQTWGFNASENRAVGTKLGNIKGVSNEAASLLQQASDLSAQVDRTDYPDINKIMLAGKQAFGNPAVGQFRSVTNALVNLMAKAAVGTGGSTDLARQMATETLDTAWSNGQYQAGLAQFRRELNAYLQGGQNAAQELHDEFVAAHGGKASKAPAMDMATEPPVPGAVRGLDGTGWYVKGRGKVAD